MQEQKPLVDLASILAEHVDCDYTKRVPIGLKELDPDGVKHIIANATKPVVIKFGKDFCGWTKKLNRVLQVLVPRYADRAEFYEVNIPSYPQVRDEYALDTSPMMLLFKDGNEVDRSDAAEAHEVPPVFERWFGRV